MNLMAGHTPDRSTSSPGGSLASHTAMPDCEKEMTTTVRSGQRCLELSERLGRSGLLGKTLLASSAWTAGVYSGEYSLTWKMRAIRRKHILFQLSVSKRRTKDTGFGLLPTAKAQNASSPGIHGRGGMDLQTKIALLPTPKASGGAYQQHKMADGTKKKNPTLQGFVALLPTPDAGIGKTGDMGADRAGTGKQMNTETTLMEALGRKAGYRLQPEFVEWMMGFPPGWTELERYPPRPKKAKGTG